MKKSKVKPGKQKSMNKKEGFTILFVCSGNSCRSPMAKGILDKIISDDSSKKSSRRKIMTLSAGTNTTNGQLPSENAQKIALEYGAAIKHHLSAQLTKERIKMADLILAMEEKHKTAVLEIVPEANKKTHLITEYVGINKAGIADPLGKSIEKYHETAKELYEILLKVYKKITTSGR